jgi:hypothetical protein
MVNKAVLSLDLDFFNRQLSIFKKTLNKIRELSEKGIPSIALDAHQKVVPYIKELNFNYLINIDTHSDLAGYKKEELTNKIYCGDWIDHIGDKDKNYLWIHPKRGGSRCDWKTRRNDFFTLNSTFYSQQSDTDLSAIDDFEIIHISIVSSFHICDRYTDSAVIEILQKEKTICDWISSVWVEEEPLKTFLEEQSQLNWDIWKRKRGN